MSKPTPRPWKRYDNTVGLGADDSWRITAFADDGDIAKVRIEADAVHIVKCVNMHDELLAALEEAVQHISSLNGETSYYEQVLAKNKADK